MTVSENQSGTQTAEVFAITSSTNATPIVVTTPTHGWSNGDHVTIVDHLVNTAANGHWVLANKTATTFELTGSVGNGIGGATGSVGKEHFQTAITAAGVYQFASDTVNLANGDLVEFRVFSKLLTGDSLSEVFYADYSNDQGDNVIKPSPPLLVPHGYQVSICQPKGTTGRAFKWAVYQA